MAVDAFLERHLPEQIVDVQRLLPLDHAVQGHGPRAELERLRRLPDLLVRAELVEVVVGGDQLLVAELGDALVELVARIARDRIEVGGRVGILGGRSATRGHRRRAGSGRPRAPEAAAGADGTDARASPRSRAAPTRAAWISIDLLPLAANSWRAAKIGARRRPSKPGFTRWLARRPLSPPACRGRRARHSRAQI